MPGFTSFNVDVAEENYENSREKARKLLQSVVPKKVWSEFEKTSYIKIEGEFGSYFISPYSQTEIRNKETGRIEACACLQLNLSAPTFDRMVAEYILIKNAEDVYRKTVNMFPRNVSETSVATCFLVAIDTALFLNFIFSVLPAATAP